MGIHFDDNLINDAICGGVHCLVAGSAGSGKSVVLNYAIMHLSTMDVEIELYDPKKVEFSSWWVNGHVTRICTEMSSIVAGLKSDVAEIESRYNEMMKKGLRRWTGRDTYIVIDEVADLMTTNKKVIEPLLCRIAQIGRAAGYHLIIATQRPTSEVLTGKLKTNLDVRVALFCRSAQDYRNVLGTSVKETLPWHGEAFVLEPGKDVTRYINLPNLTDNQLQYVLDAYKKAHSFLRNWKRKRAVLN